MSARTAGPRKPSPARSAPTRGRKPKGASGRTQAERTALSNARLLEAAAQIIAEQGYRAASLQAIGERAGYSRGLVTERFGSKEGLIRALVQQSIATHRWQDVGSEVGGRALRRAARGHRDILLQEPLPMRALYMLIYEAQSPGSELHEDFKKYDRGVRARFATWLKEAQTRGELPDVDPAIASVLYMALLRGITMQWLSDPEAVPVERVYAAFDRLLERWLGDSKR